MVTPLKDITPEEVGIFIPARYAASRLPGKPLREFAGKPLLQWAWDAAQNALEAGVAAVLTESAEILEWCLARQVAVFGSQEPYQTGTDRIASLLKNHTYDGVRIWVNLQCDEPDVTGEDLDELIRALIRYDAQAATLAGTLGERDLQNPHCVKVVTSRLRQAIYFSRAAIAGPLAVKQHIGVYALTRSCLRMFANAPRGHLEQSENLEQLRLLEQGIPIYVHCLRRQLRGVNVEADLKV